MEITYKAALAVIFILAVTLSIAVTHAQTNDKPCSAPEASQFDFWVGKWQLNWKDPDGTVKSGTNVINKILGSCVIEENFTSGDSTFFGKSVSMYNPAKKLWQQTWVDNSGAYLDFTGGKEGDKMILKRKATNRKGVEVMQRMVFYDISQNEFKWDWEYSSDEGVTWSLVWKINYTRMQ
ncbi:MAG: hypothetical protein HOP31_11905 [Ignavibacteria bacterium]|nr:hypothetical protein [Ignavibacteria bacterium]